MRYLKTALAVASPLLAMHAVQGILFVLLHLQRLMLDCFPPDAAIVSSAIALTTAHATLVAIGLAGYAVYMWQVHNKRHIREVMMSAAKAAALVAPVSVYLVAR